MKQDNAPGKKFFGKLPAKGAVLLPIPVIIAMIFTAWPAYDFSRPGEAGLDISIKKVTVRRHLCSEEELQAKITGSADLRPHMRARAELECGSRDRVSLLAKLQIDGITVIDREIVPGGIRNDRACFLYNRMELPSGKHEVRLELAQLASEGTPPEQVILAETIEFRAGTVTTITLDDSGQKTVIIAPPG